LAALTQTLQSTSSGDPDDDVQLDEFPASEVSTVALSLVQKHAHF